VHANVMTGVSSPPVARRDHRSTRLCGTLCGPVSDSAPMSSRTARMVAALRAWASAREGAIIHDRWAAALAGDDGEADARVYLRAHPHVEIYMAVRTAFLDDAVKAATGDGIDQVVILGAGYDTRAARLANGRARFFEVDQPSTQTDKRARLASIDYPIDAATYVPCNFEREDFLERLAAWGFAADRPAIFVWEGVVYYLTEGAVRATLARIASCDAHSRLFFDYVGKRFVEGEVKDVNDARARDLVREMGEPLLFGVNDVTPLLYESGFRYVRTTSFDEACLALTGTYDRARKLRFQSIAEARVAAPPRP
jgi:methyltransferase (TIGR00027 family)